MKFSSSFLAIAVVTTTAMAQSAAHVTTAVSSAYQMNGVAIAADGRMFVSLPRWAQPDSVSVGVVRDGMVVPYPGGGWNASSGDVADRFSSVNAVRIEPRDPSSLWVVDCGKGGIAETKLVQIDLQENSVKRVYRLSETEAPAQSCLNDVRVVGNHAFLTESGTGALIVIDLPSGKVRRLLSASAKTKAPDHPALVADGRPVVDPSGKPAVVHADGIEVSPDQQWLYFCFPLGGRLWRVRIGDLLNQSLSEHDLDTRVQDQGELMPVGGILMLGDGSLLLGDLLHHALSVRLPNGTVRTLVTAPEILWPDAMAVGADGQLYEAASQANASPHNNHGQNATVTPFRILKFSLPARYKASLAPLVPKAGEGGAR